MKLISLLVSVLVLLVSSAGAQTDPSEWHRYTVKDEKFSVALPGQPAIYIAVVRGDPRGERLEITVSSYADGVVYLIDVFDNASPKKSLGTFIKDRGSSARRVNHKSERELTLDGTAGKTFSFDGIDGAVQFFSKGDRLYRFAAYGASQDDVRVTRFFSSISLINNKDAFELPDNMPARPLPSSSGAPEQIFTPQEVDKNFQVVMNPVPQYTEAARQEQIKGTIVLQCTLSAMGQVTTISVVEGLPRGLTERAIAAARQLKFIPAMKNGKYVSISTRLVYRFDLF
jgi:TonB family protein